MIHSSELTNNPDAVYAQPNRTYDRTPRRGKHKIFIGMAPVSAKLSECWKKGTASNLGCISLLRMCHKRVKMKKLVKSSNKNEVNNMTPSDQQQLKAHLKAAAEIIYRNTDPTELKSFETIEKSVRQKC
jgi:hypothetical protein